MHKKYSIYLFIRKEDVKLFMSVLLFLQTLKNNKTQYSNLSFFKFIFIC